MLWSFWLSYILGFISDAVDQVCALTSDIVLAWVHCGSGIAFKGVPKQGDNIDTGVVCLEVERYVFVM